MLKKLLDFRFETFITPYILGAVLGILYIVAVLGWLGYLFTGDGSFIERLILLVIGLPLSIVGIRVWVESIVSIVKIAENTSKIVEELEAFKKLRDK
ncbi:MAG: DUF4282 domain-containing protein [Desulfurobacteriaceae bacterium]